MEPKIRIAVVTQNDEYAIPRNFKLLCDSVNINISELIVVDALGSLENKRMLFVRGFGLQQTIKMVFVTLYAKLRSFCASSFRFIDRPEWLNLKGLCILYNIPLKTEQDVNCEAVLNRLRKKELDVIVSFSAPTIFKTDLLSLPRYGCINLHCSALPSYAGVMPSFWVLLNDEKQAGMSVHLMDSKIDNGSVLAQEVIDISHIDNMFDVIQATKLRGGYLMLDVLNLIRTNNSLPEPIDTSHNKESYFTWPKVEDFKRLVKKGKKLI
ncbi:formyltransferase family protein [Pseudomonadales bacterium]|nr:formyltransferase family protein [Pseudomonadales bacterium]